MSVCTTEAFLLEIASEEVKARIQKNIHKKKTLDERDLMELIVLPLAYKGRENQRNAAQEAVLLAKEIEDEVMREMALAGILSFSDKIIDKKLANEIRRCLSMTKVGVIIAKEMEESEEKGRQKGRTEGQIASIEFFQEIKKSTKVSQLCTDIPSVTTKKVVHSLKYQLT